jgi:hypothetical protein
MNVGDHGDLEREIGGPSRRRKIVPRDAKLQDRFAEPVSRGSNAKCAQSTKRPEETTA